MANRLTKTSKAVFTPGVTFVPGVPARCYTSTYNTVVYTELGKVFNPTYKNGKLVLTPAQTALAKNANLIQGFTSVGGKSDSVLTGEGSFYTASYVIFYAVRSIPTQQTVCSPAVAEVPGKLSSYVVDNQRGWTSGARSAVLLPGDMVAQFRLPPTPTGIVCGLAGGTKTTDIGAVEHGVYASVGQYQIIESGVVVANSPVPPDSAPLVRISRNGSKVTYEIDDWSYQSDKPSSGGKCLQACMYVAGDYVDSPSLAKVVSLSGDGYAGARATASTNTFDVYSLRGTARAGVVGQDRGIAQGLVSLRLSVLGANTAYSQGKVELPPVGVVAYGGFPVVNVGGGQVSLPFYTQGDSKTGGIGGGGVSLPLLLRGSQGVYGEGRVRLPPLLINAVGVPPSLTTDTATGLAVIDGYFFQPTVFFVLNESMTIGSSVELVFVFQEDLAEFLALGDTADATFIIDMLIKSGLGIGDDLSQVNRDLVQYVTNAATGGVTRYDNFGFRSFVQVGQRSFGLRADGLYELTGESDNGELISAIVDFVAEDFDTAMKKRVDNLYVGLATDGQIFVRLRDDDGREVTYRAAQYKSTYKVKTGKGLASRFWNMRLEIVGATYGEVDNVEWYVGATGRRLGR
jgi:hypothetical protein